MRPLGRPPNATKSVAASIARQIAEATNDGSALVKFALAVWQDTNMSMDDRKWAFEWLADRAAGKAAATVDFNTTHTQHVRVTMEHYTMEELDELERLQEKAKQRALAAPKKVIDVAE